MWLRIKPHGLYLVPGLQYCQVSHHRTQTQYIHRSSIADCVDTHWLTDRRKNPHYALFSVDLGQALGARGNFLNNRSSIHATSEGSSTRNANQSQDETQPSNRSSFNCNGNNVCKDRGRDRVRYFAQYTHSRSHVPARHTRNDGRACACRLPPGRYGCCNLQLRRTKPPTKSATVAS
jgi:hypothetical protein